MSRPRLASLRAVRREMSAVYADARAGEIEAGTGSRLIYMLGQVGSILQAEIAETRLAKLEVIASELDQQN